MPQLLPCPSGRVVPRKVTKVRQQQLQHSSKVLHLSLILCLLAIHCMSYCPHPNTTLPLQLLLYSVSSYGL
jgi:hypothetical protein